jgi:uracil-DNA glycosylase
VRKNFMSIRVQREASPSFPLGWDGAWDWTEELIEQFRAPYFRSLCEFVERERRTHTIFPPAEQTFEAFRRTPLHTVRVVILGQDPYLRPGQAHGLSFSVGRGQALPPSLRNIFCERQADLQIDPPNHGDLGAWADQGVLLLNTVLTVREGQSNSHCGQGWERFTDSIIRIVSARRPYVAFVLWGNSAIQKQALIDSRHGIFQSAHPSPLSARRGFFGSRVFSRCNQALIAQGLAPISW